jgi:Mitochondrial ribosomal subunit protein
LAAIQWNFQVKLSSIPLEGRARDKFLRLVKERYSPIDDTVTVVTDRCPTKKQNADYANFLLTALYHESMVRITILLFSWCSVLAVAIHDGQKYLATFRNYDFI